MLFAKTTPVFALSLVQFLVSSNLSAMNCDDAKDTYAHYDNTVKDEAINNIASQYYLLSYSWAPSFCASVSEKSRQGGGKNYLQCGSGRSFGYILHGLWPQGSLTKRTGYPRACAGDRDKIARDELTPFLCMTPSVWLLQHEYEYHGTCMGSAYLRTAQGYFKQAKSMHDQLQLPQRLLEYNDRNLAWWYTNNRHLVPGSVQFSRRSKEWQLCYDDQFRSMACPTIKSIDKTTEKTTDKVQTQQWSDQSAQCLIKGNISKKSNRRWYFTPSHANYNSVVISKSKGERCFNTEADALQAGWLKAQ